MTQDPFVCARCAAISGTCCRMDPADSGKCFPLSETERARLVPHAARLGVPDAAVERNTPAFHALVLALFPGKKEQIVRAFPPGGVHFRLPLDPGGNCLFLREDGCALPRDARPWYCQLFPVWVRKGYFDWFHAEHCLIARESRSLQDVFAAVELTRGRAGTLYLSLCRDWGLENT